MPSDAKEEVKEQYVPFPPSLPPYVSCFLMMYHVHSVYCDTGACAS